MEGNEGYREAASPISVSSVPASPRYAGFIIRAIAGIIDDIILIILFIIPAVIVAFAMTGVRSTDHGTFLVLLILFMLVAGATAWLYNAVFESSRYMATPGKMVCGLKVTDMDGRRISFARATLRYFMKSVVYTILSFISKCIGFIYGIADILAMFTNEQRQCIHDLVAGTVVVHDEGKYNITN